jgi:hypothetical protein
MKMTKVVLTIAGVMAFGAAHAATQALAGATNTLQSATCTLLNEDVTINISNNIRGGIACDDTQIVVATCSIAGRTTSRSTTSNTPAGCDDDDAVDCTGTEVTTVTGAEMPYATTLRGTVIKGYPGSGATCDTEATAVTSYANSKL